MPQPLLWVGAPSGRQRARSWGQRRGKQNPSDRLRPPNTFCCASELGPAAGGAGTEPFPAAEGFHPAVPAAPRPQGLPRSTAARKIKGAHSAAAHFSGFISLQLN